MSEVSIAWICLAVMAVAYCAGCAWTEYLDHKYPRTDDTANNERKEEAA